jgi:hypothetical protein
MSGSFGINEWLERSNAVRGNVEALGGKKIRSVYINTYFINGVNVIIRAELFGEYEFAVCDDDGFEITNFNKAPSIERIIENLPTKEEYVEMKKRHEYDTKREIYGNIEAANVAYNNELNKLKKTLLEQGIEFINEDECKCCLNRIPVELVPNLVSSVYYDISNYNCYVINSFGHRTDIIYKGELTKIINSLLTFDEYKSLYGAECKSARLKK